MNEVDPAMIHIQEVLAGIQDPATEAIHVLQSQAVVAAIVTVQYVQRNVDLPQSERSSGSKNNFEQSSDIVAVTLANTVEKAEICLLDGSWEGLEDVNPAPRHPRNTLSHSQLQTIKEKFDV